jgi:uncharacterized protein YacL
VSGPDHRREVPHGRFVEFVRLIFVVLFAAAGYIVATQLGTSTTQRTLLGVILGSGIGFVLGGVFGRQTASAVSSIEREFRRVPAAELVAGAAGLIAGLAIAALLSVPLFRLPPLAAWTTVSFIYATLGFAGWRLGRMMNAELFALIGLKPRAAGGRADLTVVDTSALIDGRVVELAKTGFLTGDLLIHGAVLAELQSIADSSDPKRRGRGRRGLDAVAELQAAPTVQVHLVEEPVVGDVDAALVRLARERGASLITTDHNLAKVAEALRLPVGPGDELTIELVKEGREHGQAVGYLEDGTMVVVEQANDRIGSQVPVVARNVIRTATGRMVFASLLGAERA